MMSITANRLSLQSCVLHVAAALMAAAIMAFTLQNCCLIDHMRIMETAAKESGAAFELVVYPQAEHHFNVTGAPVAATTPPTRGAAPARG